MKAALIQEDRLTDEHKAKWSLWDYARAHKNILWQPRRKISKATFPLLWIYEMKQQSLFCYLPLIVLNNVQTFQLHVILSPQTPWSKFRADSRVREINGQQLNVFLWSHIFLLLRLFEFIIRKKFNLTLSADISFTLIIYTHAVLSSGNLILLPLLANMTTHICLTTTCGIPADSWLLVCCSTTCKSLRAFGSQLIQRILRALKYT